MRSWGIETPEDLLDPRGTGMPHLSLPQWRLQTAPQYGFVSPGADRPVGHIQRRSLGDGVFPSSEDTQPFTISPVKDMALDLSEINILLSPGMKSYPGFRFQSFSLASGEQSEESVRMPISASVVRTSATVIFVSTWGQQQQVVNTPVTLYRRNSYLLIRVVSAIKS